MNTDELVIEITVRNQQGETLRLGKAFSPVDDEIENWLRSDGIRRTLQMARELGAKDVTTESSCGGSSCGCQH